MVKTIISAIGTALRAVFVLARGVLSIPGRLVGSLFGGGTAPPVEDTLEVQDLVAKLAEADAEEQDNWRKIADAIWRWCVDSLIADGPVAVPSMLPRSVREWLPGLTPQEAEIIVSADRKAVQAHARGLYGLPGVRKVQGLTPVKEWPSEPVEPAPTRATEPRSVHELRALLRGA